MKHLMETMINIFVSIVHDHDIELKLHYTLESTINKQCNIPRRMTVVLPQPK